MDAKKHHAAIIGCGKIAGGYDHPSSLMGQKALTHAGALTLHPDVELTACCDIEASSAESFSRKWNVIEKFSIEKDFFEFAKQNIDILIIATPDHTHFEMLSKGVEAELKTIICEKPVCLSKGEMEQIYSLVDKSKSDITINHTRRWSEDVKDLKKRLQDGLLGDIKIVNGYYSGGFLHSGIHLIDLIKMFFGQSGDFIPVYSRYDCCIKDHYLSMDFGNNSIRGQISSVDFGGFDVFELDILGTEGRVVLPDFTNKIRYYKKGTSEFYPGDIELVRCDYGREWDYSTALYSLIDAACKSSSGQEKFSYNIKDALKTMEAVFEIVEKVKK